MGNLEENRELDNYAVDPEAAQEQVLANLAKEGVSEIDTMSDLEKSVRMDEINRARKEAAEREAAQKAEDETAAGRIKKFLTDGIDAMGTS